MLVDRISFSVAAGEVLGLAGLLGAGRTETLEVLFGLHPELAGGEVFVNGKSQGVSPPKKFIKLDPGKYKIEVKNTTFPVHAQNLEVKTRDEVTLKHRFQ